MRTHTRPCTSSVASSGASYGAQVTGGNMDLARGAWTSSSPVGAGDLIQEIEAKVNIEVVPVVLSGTQILPRPKRSRYPT